MWAQLMKVRSKPEREPDLQAVFEQLQAIEPPDSGLVRTTAMRSQSDPDLVYVLVVFDSEEKARARERDPGRQEGLKSIQAAMAEILDGPREFIDLNVLRDA
jgi:heme-degrading monooxygenase HmoA